MKITQFSSQVKSSKDESLGKNLFMGLLSFAGGTLLLGPIGGMIAGTVAIIACSKDDDYYREIKDKADTLIPESLEEERIKQIIESNDYTHKSKYEIETYINNYGGYGNWIKKKTTYRVEY